jgi:membrane associated rhomboid family serine protease
MSWYDRDYAQAGPAPWGRARPVRGSRLWGGSIVSTLIAINVVVYVLGAFSPTLAEYLYGFGMMQSEAVMNGQVWRLITAQYLHGGTGHLLLNMIGLHFLGRPLEQMWSARKFFVIYSVCGLIGNVFYTILGSRGVLDPRMPAVGASGSIYGLLGIVAVMFPHATVFLMFMFPMKIRTAALVFGGIAFLTVLERGPNYSGEACHLAGLLFGAWWAWKGDGWWQRTEWRVPKRGVRARPIKGTSFAEQTSQRRDDAELIDRILRKVYEGGIHSLNESEKRALQEATERQRQREQEFDRADRM